ncbi:hypothetical protein P7C70_g1725, partial [Phenoliferia sp. Uapishka_3]
MSTRDSQLPTPASNAANDASDSPPMAPADGSEPVKFTRGDYDEDGNLEPRFTMNIEGIKWFKVFDKSPERYREVCVGRSSTTYDYVLLKKEGRETESPLYDILSLPYQCFLDVPELPKGPNYICLHAEKGSGREASYSDLEKLGIIRRTDASVKFDYEVHPIVELLLERSEMLQSCANAGCGGNEGELGIGEERFKVCGGCGLQAYCSTEHGLLTQTLQCQTQDWKSTHKKECKLVKERKFGELEAKRQEDNRRTNARPVPLATSSKETRTIALAHTTHKLILRPASLRAAINEAATLFSLDPATFNLKIQVGQSWYEVTEDTWDTAALTKTDPMPLKVSIDYVKVKRAREQEKEACASEDELKPPAKKPTPKPPTPMPPAPKASSEIPGQVFQISIELIENGDRKVLQMSVRSSTTIKRIKRAIENEWRIPTEDQALTHEGYRVQDSRTVADYDISDGETLQLYPALKGGKPIIYLFPPTPLADATVKLSLSRDWTFSALYPISPITPNKSGGSSTTWTVSASTNGELTEITSGTKLSSLFWEAHTVGNVLPPSPPFLPVDSSSHLPSPPFNPNLATLTRTNSILLSFDDLLPYLQSTLSSLTLHTAARTEFITYWLPSFNRINESGKQVAVRFIEQAAYEQAAKLEVEPKPDVVTRVFMVFKGVEANEAWSKNRLDWREVVGVKEAATDVTRFRVLEWGGMEVLN